MSQASTEGEEMQYAQGIPTPCSTQFPFTQRSVTHVSDSQPSEWLVETKLSTIESEFKNLGYSKPQPFLPESLEYLYELPTGILPKEEYEKTKTNLAGACDELLLLMGKWRKEETATYHSHVFKCPEEWCNARIFKEPVEINGRLHIEGTDDLFRVFTLASKMYTQFLLETESVDPVTYKHTVRNLAQSYLEACESFAKRRRT